MKLTGSLLVCAAAGLFAAGALVLNGGPSTTASAGGTVGPTTQIEISDFTLAATPVAPGSTVTVANRDGEAHTVTATDGTFDSGQIPSGKAIAFIAPTVPGTYQIVCTIHPSMHQWASSSPDAPRTGRAPRAVPELVADATTSPQNSPRPTPPPPRSTPMIKTRILVGLAAAGVLLGACGSGDSSKPSAAAPARHRRLPTTAAPAPAPPPAPPLSVKGATARSVRSSSTRRQHAVRVHQRHRRQVHLHRHVRRGVAAGRGRRLVVGGSGSRRRRLQHGRPLRRHRAADGRPIPAVLASPAMPDPVTSTVRAPGACGSSSTPRPGREGRRGGAAAATDQTAAAATAPVRPPRWATRRSGSSSWTAPAVRSTHSPKTPTALRHASTVAPTPGRR